MRGKAYVALHHSKGLASTIVRHLFLRILIKGQARNLRLKSQRLQTIRLNRYWLL